MEVKDARGLLCPEPVLITKTEIDRLGRGTIQVLIDNAAARDNITRLAKSQGWEVSVEQSGEEYTLTLKK